MCITTSGKVPLYSRALIFAIAAVLAFHGAVVAHAQPSMPPGFAFDPNGYNVDRPGWSERSFYQPSDRNSLTLVYIESVGQSQDAEQLCNERCIILASRGWLTADEAVGDRGWLAYGADGPVQYGAIYGYRAGRCVGVVWTSQVGQDHYQAQLDLARYLIGS